MADLRAEVRAAVHAAIDESNAQREPELRLEQADDTVLFGESGVLDSLGLVNLIVAVEEQMDERLGLVVTLADERAMAQERNPFETVGSLVEYAASLAEEASSDR